MEKGPFEKVTVSKVVRKQLRKKAALTGLWQNGEGKRKVVPVLN